MTLLPTYVRLPVCLFVCLSACPIVVVVVVVVPAAAAAAVVIPFLKARFELVYGKY